MLNSFGLRFQMTQSVPPARAVAKVAKQRGIPSKIVSGFFLKYCNPIFLRVWINECGSSIEFCFEL